MDISKFSDGLTALTMSALEGFGNIFSGTLVGVKDAAVGLTNSGILSSFVGGGGLTIDNTGLDISPSPTSGITQAPAPLMGMEQLRENALDAYAALPDSVKSMVDSIQKSLHIPNIQDANVEALTQSPATTPVLGQNTRAAGAGLRNS